MVSISLVKQALEQYIPDRVCFPHIHQDPNISKEDMDIIVDVSKTKSPFAVRCRLPVKREQ